MKKILLLIFILSLTISVSAKITLTSMTGFVQIKETENSEWLNPQIGQNLQPGYIIYTGFNSTAILKTDNAQIDVKPLSQISISSLISTADKVATDIYLKYGKIRADVDSSKETQTLFKVRSANSTASVRGTIFTFGEDNLFVEKGTVHLLSNNGFSTLVQSDERAEASKMNFIKTPFYNLSSAAYLNTLPTGMSDSEIDNLLDLVSSKIRGSAKVIIRIHIIK